MEVLDPKELKYVELIKKLNNSDLKAIITPVLPEVCEGTTDEVTFALKLVALKVMTDNQFEQFKLEGTPFQKNTYLYCNLMKKPAGKELIEALQKSGNEHIIKILIKSYGEVIAKVFEDAEQLIKKLNSSELHAIISSLLPDLCKRTTGSFDFAVNLESQGIITSMNQLDEFKRKKTSLEKNYFLYSMIMKNPVAKELIKALKHSGNEHIIAMIAESYRKVNAKVYKYNAGCTNAGNSSVTTSQPFFFGGQSLHSAENSQELLIASSTSACESVDSDDGSNSSVTVTRGYKNIVENAITFDSKTATGSELIPKVQDSKTKTIKLRLFESIEVIYDQLSPELCPRPLKHLEFVHTKSMENSLKPLQFSRMRQPLNFPQLISLTMKIDQEDDDSVHKKTDNKNGLPPKKILLSLLSVFDWDEVKRNKLYDWFGVKKNKKRNRLNNLWDLFPQINVVDIRIGNKTILYFNKQDGQLTVHWMSFFDPNKYLKKAAADLKKFSCAKNYKPLSMSSISPNNLTELNLRNCKFDFDPKNKFNLNDFLPKYKNLSKLIMSASEYNDSNSNTFNLGYITTASKLKIVTLGNFTVTITVETGDSAAQKFVNIWNRFQGQTLTFCDCNLIGLKLDAMEELKARAENNQSGRKKDKIIVQLQKLQEFDGQETANGASIGDENNVSWHLSRSTSSDSDTDSMGYGWSLISFPYKASINLQQTYDKISYSLFQIKDFSIEPCNT